MQTLSKMVLVTICLLYLAGCQTIDRAGHTTAQTARSAQGMAATAQPMATRAARSILEAGGNAADAAIAAAFVLAVVEPTMSGIGGRSQILVRTQTGVYAVYNGMTQIPAAYVRPDTLPANGYGTIATPGVIAALNRLHREHGSLSLSTLMAPAIELAEKGFEVLPGEAARHLAGLKDFKDNQGFQQSFLKPDGTTYLAGEWLRQPELARTLKRLSSAGLEDFYSGAIAASIVADLQENGGYVTAQDLLDYVAADARYVSTRYRDYEIHSMAAPGGGGLVIKALNILENFAAGSLTNQQWGAVLAQVVAMAIDSMRMDYTETDLELVMSKEWASVQASQIILPPAAEEELAPLVSDTKVSMDWTGASWGEESHHTTHFVTADCSGMLVSATQTVGPLFGSKVISRDLGFVYASTMGTYLSASAQAPGSQPRTTIAPTLVTKNGEPILVLGAAGGLRILSAIVQSISRHVDQGLPLAEAIAAPRVHPVYENDPRTGERLIQMTKFQAETSPGIGWQPADLQAWEAQGFTVTANDKTGAFGRVHAILKSDGGWLGVADPDWEGTAEGASRSKCAAENH